MRDEKIALIGGTGDLGFGLAVRWAGAGVSVLIGSRERQKAQEAAERARSALKTSGAAQSGSAAIVEGLENPEAAAQASVVILAVPFTAQAAILKSIRDSLQGAILVDTTVPLEVTVGGKRTRMLGLWEGSAAQRAREMVPPATPVLAAFHNVSAEGLQDLSCVLDCDVLVCGDDQNAKDILFPLIRKISGLRPIDAGPLEMARIVEGITALLLSLNRKYRIPHSGIRITGLSPSEDSAPAE